MKSRSGRRLLYATILGFVLVLGVSAREYLKKDYMGVEDATKRWGHETFDPQKFKSGDVKKRASMVSSLIEGKTLVGKPLSEIRPLLGEFSGHYWNDNIPTYIVEEGWKTNSDTWQLVFLPGQNQTVREIKIHKNCCSR